MRNLECEPLPLGASPLLPEGEGKSYFFFGM
jgi:hypothetical protein